MASYPPELIVGDAHIVPVQSAELIRKLESISYMMYLHEVWFPLIGILDKGPGRFADRPGAAFFEIEVQAPGRLVRNSLKSSGRTRVRFPNFFARNLPSAIDSKIFVRPTPHAPQTSLIVKASRRSSLVSSLTFRNLR